MVVRMDIGINVFDFLVDMYVGWCIDSVVLFVFFGCFGIECIYFIICILGMCCFILFY
jgi:hypothetical protein